MPQLTDADLWYLAARHFGDLGPSAVANAYAIAHPESGGNVQAFNPADPYGGSYGIMQINGVHGYDPNKLLNDPDYNFAAARQVHDGAGGFTPWSTYTNGSYANYLPGGSGMAFDPQMASAPGMQTFRSQVPSYPYPQGPQGQPAVPSGGGFQVPLGQELDAYAVWKLQQLQNLGINPAATTGMYPAEFTGGPAGTFRPSLGGLNLLQGASGPADYLKYGYFANQLLGNQQGAENPWLRYNTQMRPDLLGSGGGGATMPQPPPASIQNVPQPPYNFTGQEPQDQNLYNNLTQPGVGQNAEGELGQFRNAAQQQFGAGFGRAYGGQGSPMGNGMYGAMVGDPQRGNQANPEIVTSSAPFHVTPMNQMPAHLRSGLDRMATGGTVDAPFFKQLTGGAPAFGRSTLGQGWGEQPFSYVNYQQQLPSEQQMLRGYVETPRELGGLGGYFPDELERARRAAVTGPSFAGAGMATYG